jgi:hypothetical protein
LTFVIVIIATSGRNLLTDSIDGCGEQQFEQRAVAVKVGTHLFGNDFEIEYYEEEYEIGSWVQSAAGKDAATAFRQLGRTRYGRQVTHALHPLHRRS